VQANRLRRGLAVLAAALWVAARAPIGHAQTDDADQPPGGEEPRQRRVLEEIVVTAQKTEERLHDVPISMTVLDAEFLRQESVGDLHEVAQYVPNVKVLSTAFTPQANIRGFELGRDANKGSEPPMGLTIDGIPYANPNYLQSGFFDIGRIEVLRGPQNALHGKNNSVGLFSMTTKDPTEDFTGLLDVELGEPGRRRFEAGIGGPAVPGILNFRLAGLSDERDGFLGNTTAATVPEALPRAMEMDGKAIRAKVELPELAGADVVLSYERFHRESFGLDYELALVPEGTRPVFIEFDPDTSFEFGDFAVSHDFPSIIRVDVDTFVGHGSYDLGGWGLDAVVGHSSLRVDNDLDADLGPVPIITAFTKDTNPQTTVEVRATSPELPGLFGLARLYGLALGATDVTTGLFYQRRRVTDSEFTITLDTALIGAFAVLGGNPPPAGAPVPPLPVTRDAAGQSVEETTMFFEQTADAVAGFTHVNWRFAERWTLISGLRLGYESKQADFERIFSGDPPAFLTAGGFEEFTDHRARSAFQATPRLNLRYDVTEEINVFATWAKGFRGGGFNANANRPGNLEFEPEDVTNWELGTNMDLLGGTARLNLALFWMTLTEFQILTTEPGTTTSIITNAGEARARGVETDGVWLPTDWLSLRGSLGFNDAEYIDFPFGPCTGDRPDTDGDGDERCDLSGKSIHQAPRWVISLTPGVRFPLGGMPLLDAVRLPVRGIDLIGSLTVQYQDSMIVDPTLDPRLRAPSFFNVDGALGFGSLEQGWSLRVLVKNVTDVLTTEKGIQAPLLSGHFTRVAGPPRHVFGELRWGF
jgi:outer membrane receptor protein involved in Fe transport